MYSVTASQDEPAYLFCWSASNGSDYVNRFHNQLKHLIIEHILYPRTYNV